jgi:ribose/xylose/arabinose/galactoside ABC-type transport system permease subunit
MKKFDTLSVLVFIRSWGITTLLVLLWIFFSIWCAPIFGTLDNFSLLLGGSSISAIFAAAIAMGAYSGALDLSVPGTAAVAAIVMAQMIGAGMNQGVAILVALLIGAFIGVCNGLIVQTGLNPLAVTIGTLSITSGLAAIITDGLPLFDKMDQLAWLGTSMYFGIPSTFYVVLIIYVVGTIFLTKTRGGIRFLAAGGNAEALRRAGVNSNVYRLLGFTLSGLIAAIGGVITSAYTSQATPSAPTGVLFDGLTAVALSGLSLAGGRGSLPKVWVGAMVIATIGSGLLIKNIQPFWTVSITGALLILALAGEHFLGKAVAKQAVLKSNVSAHKEKKAEAN